ncbi:MAG: rhombosortase [Cellvibrionales bacterium]|nr:rhombosortase [Cellvibrionales bacterium]
MSCILIQSFHGGAWATLTQTTLTSHEYWRLLTAHFVHLNWQHLGLNMTGAGLCLLVFAKDIPIGHWLASAILISLFSSFGLLIIGMPGQYMGFSDTLYGWVILGILSIYTSDRWLSILMLGLLIGKLSYEQCFPSPFSAVFEGATIATNSHLLGVAGGFLYFGYMALLKKQQHNL